MFSSENYVLNDNIIALCFSGRNMGLCMLFCGFVMVFYGRLWSLI